MDQFCNQLNGKPKSTQNGQRLYVLRTTELIQRLLTVCTMHAHQTLVLTGQVPN